ncbi:2-polyprenyl-6-methoxyphenol hydroxylase-like FAD-dependent oxidoreductase [Pseudonocardia sediminis]|uniref:2-polyprenyl-6-methoxyphenol hydroxylase-like FAD-dependent oxidoreductase n=1 Tax=Pseudonocardia sediminis TaxID=1397368 RepID=A0A4Q7UYY6_PSEST|nr:FAD-dependent monooxygenase [Pseudonocardia sediminis]RZT85409.1 2-polyprenyl-6-methoxyphenol hydroxylase-like FAD-dependent oxidoreductase [Pseudonocardia sediminis]
MKIVCVGGGPSGLYFSILARLRSGGRDEVTVLERNGFGTAQGFAVTLGEDILDGLFRTDPVGAHAVRAAAHVWGEQVVEVGPSPVHLGGRYGYSIGRARLLEVLTERARQVGVDVRFETELTDDPAVDPLTADADLVVAADGINSPIRNRHTDHFGTDVSHGTNRYVWFGTSKAFTAFTFAFEPTEAGWIWFHAYPAADCVSTCIVECSPQTWTGLGLDRMDPDEAMQMLERRFARALDGHTLIAPPGMGASPWLRFREVRNSTWRRDNVVLMGDAAHTTHFAIGSGTVLAVADSIGLADALYGDGADVPAAADLPSALAAYDARRRAVMRPIQDMARRSMEWFEDIDARLEDDPVRFAWSLLDRRGDQGPLHYQLHRATQIEPVRQVRRRLTSARRYRRALSRGEITRAQLLTGSA